LEFEKQLLTKVYDLGRLFISLFLCMRQAHWELSHSDAKLYGKRQGSKWRLIGTVFGKVRYFRTYIYRGKIEGGYYPLDLELGLPWDGFSNAGAQLCVPACHQNELCSVCAGIKHVFKRKRSIGES
jgi:hypothetical protein